MDAPLALVHLAAPWSRLYSDSKLLATLTTFVHVAGLLLGGGLALATDRATMRAIRTAVHDRAQHLDALASVHRVVVTGLAVSFLSGLLLFLADVKTFWDSWIFWTKIGLIAA